MPKSRAALVFHSMAASATDLTARVILGGFQIAPLTNEEKETLYRLLGKAGFGIITLTDEEHL